MSGAPHPVDAVDATPEHVAAHDRMRQWSPEGERRLGALAVATFGAGARVLDGGVGSGLTAYPLVAAGLRVVGVDRSPAMLAALAGRGDLAVAYGDLTALPVRDGGVDGVFVSNVMHHVPAWPAALAELARVLRPGGTLLMNLGDGPADGEVREVSERYQAAVGDEATAPPAEHTGITVEAVQRCLTDVGAPLVAEHVVEDTTHHDTADVVDWLGGNPWLWGRMPDAAAHARLVAEVGAWAHGRFGDRPLRRTRQVLYRAYRKG